MDQASRRREADGFLQRRLGQLGASLTRLQLRQRAVCRGIELVEAKRALELVAGEVVLIVKVYRNPSVTCAEARSGAIASARSEASRAGSRYLVSRCWANCRSWRGPGPRTRARTAGPARRSSRAVESPFRAPAAGSNAPASRARADSLPAGRPRAAARRPVAERAHRLETTSSSAAATTAGASIQNRKPRGVAATGAGAAGRETDRLGQRGDHLPRACETLRG